MSAFFCALCNRVVEINNPTGKRNRFCGTRCRNEFHNNHRLSARQFRILLCLSKGDAEMAKTNTVYAMSNENVLRRMPLIELVEGNTYRITQTGQKFLKLMLDRNSEQ